MRHAHRRIAVLVVAALAIAASRSVVAQLKYERGQNVAPVYEGWRRLPDGTIRMYFGYLNRNYQEVIDLPIGPANSFDPADADRGQPTHFLPRRQRFVFQVAVPRDWDPKKRLSWTLVANGKSEKAQGWLQPEWEIDDGVIQMNLGPGGAPPADPPNLAPTITGSAAQTVTFPATVTLSASATDDGIPKPRRLRPGAPPPAAGSVGVNLRWIHYRGAGAVQFSQPSAARVYDKPAELTTTAAFSAPGTYVLMAIANDGLLESSHAVTVTVK